MDLLTACKKNRVREALELLSSGADPNRSSRLGESPLHWAAINSNVELVHALLAAGADPNASTKSKHAVGNGCGTATPLHFAASRGSIEVVELLLSNGADASATDATGSSVLTASIYSPNREILRRLVQAGADPNDGTLSIASRDADIEMVRELLQLGASPRAVGDGMHPLRMAQAFNRRDVMELLIAAGQDLTE
jgi:ankyrin repeat protein